MAANGAVVSYSGGPPGRVREANAFDWIFEDPFQQENDYTSSERRLAKIEGDRPIFVDNKTGKTIDSSSLDYSYDPPILATKRRATSNVLRLSWEDRRRVPMISPSP